VKYEKIFLEEFETVPELLSGLKEYFGITILRDRITPYQEKQNYKRIWSWRN
tara:strand:+ start:119 stop:274 length:156 start_codon:yes stop_codon:yes gene_type:complete